MKNGRVEGSYYMLFLHNINGCDTRSALFEEGYINVVLKLLNRKTDLLEAEEVY